MGSKRDLTGDLLDADVRRPAGPADGRSGIVAPEFVPIAEAVKDASAYESWSRFCLEKLDLLLAKAAALGVAAPERVET